MLSSQKKIMELPTVTFEITYKCNFNCFHCYQNLRKKELSFSQICQILDNLYEEGATWLMLSGGEPLVRKDFKDIYIYAKKKGFIVSVMTNGSLINKEIIDIFKKYKPYVVSVSLYGIDEDSYKSFTNTKGNFSKVKNNIDRLIKNKISINFRTLLTRQNYFILKKMIKFAESKVKKQLYIDPLVFGGLDIKRNKDIFEKCRIPLNLMKKAYYDSLEYKRYRTGMDNDLIRRENNPKPKNLNCFFRCDEKEGGLTIINPSGDLSLCSMLRKPSFNLLKYNFNYARERILKYIRTKKFPKGHKCANCNYQDSCNMCPGWSEREYGTHDKVVEYICKLTKSVIKLSKEK